MKQQYFIIILLLCTAFVACKKADNELAELEGMPSVNTGEINLYEAGGTNGIRALYPTEVLVGDTITLAGRLHVKDGATMTLGKAPVEYIFTTQREFKDYASGIVVLMDVVRFVVTAQMGAGPQPLVIRNGRFVRTAPDINIRTVPGISSRPDTTLTVTEVMTQDIAGFAARYNANIQVPGPRIFQGYRITDNGEVWLQSPLDIYRIRNGQAENFLKTGDALTIDGQAVQVYEFLGMTVNNDATEMYLSIDCRLTSTTGRYYLLKMDMASRQTTVINTTSYRLRSSQPPAQLVEVIPSSFMNIGPVTDIPVKASSLQLDSLGRMLFRNVIGVYLENTVVSEDNLSRINSNGRMNVMLENVGSSDRLKYNELLTISANGRYAYIIPSTDGVMCYDLELEEIVAKADAAQGLFQISFEQKNEYRFSAPLLPFYYSTNNSYTVLRNGELLQSKGVSLGAIDLRTASVYAYAGLERGFSQYAADQLPIQTNVTGQARYVSFAGSVLLGTDTTGNVYFMRGGTKSSSQGVTGPKIYRLGKP
jgi:hypothetical protein